MNNNEEILIDVKVDTEKVRSQLQDVIAAVGALKNEQKELKKQIEAGGEAADALTQVYAQNDQQIKMLTASQKALTGQLQTTDKSTEELGDSFRELDARARQLENQYKALTKAQRESVAGQQLKKELIASKQALKDFDEELGNHQRNVGNYPSAINGIIPYMDKFNKVIGNVGLSMEDFAANGRAAFKKLGSGMAQLGKQAASLLANPYVLAIAAVLAALKMLYDAFQRSEQAQEKMEKAMIPFVSLWQNLERVFDDVVKTILQLTSVFGQSGKVFEYYYRALLLPLNLAFAGLRMQMNNVRLVFTTLTAGIKAGFNAIKDVLAKTPMSDWFAKAKEQIDGVIVKVQEFAAKTKEVYDKIKNSDIAKMLGFDQYLEGMEDIIGSNNELIKSNEKIKESEREVKRMRLEATKADADATNEIAALKAKAADKDKYTAEERIGFLKQAQDKEEEIAQRALELAKAQYEAEKLKNSLTESNLEDLQREADAYAAMVAAEAALSKKQEENAKQVSAIRNEQRAEAKAAAAARLEIERELEDSILALERDEVQKSMIERQRAGDREVENLRVKLDSLKREDKKGRELLEQLIVAKEAETQQALSDMAIKATAEREQKIREMARAEAEIGVRDSQELAQLKLQNTQEEYERLQNMTKEQIEVLYNTEEDYQRAVIDAQRAFYDAKEALAAEQYAREQQRVQNEFEQRKNEAWNNELEQANLELEQAAYENEQLVNMDEQTKARLYKSQEAYEAAIIASNKRVADAQRNAVEQQRKMAMANASAVAGAMDALSGLLDQFSEDNKAAAVASKAVALAKIAIDTGVAIAGGVAQAQSVPFPANIAAIATTIATVVANMATAISTVKSAKFATGGIVGGTSYTGDKVPAMLNSGEMVLNRESQTRLFDALSGSSDTGLGINYEAMAAVVAAQPAPVMVLKELRQFEDKVNTYQEIASV